MTDGTCTDILKKSRTGDHAATGELLELVYDKLRAIARGYLHRHRRHQTLQATDVVHEAYMKLVGQENLAWQDRTHFIAIAASAMRQVLVAYARKRDSQKRGGGWNRVPLQDTLALSGRPDLDILCLDEALSRLEQLHERQARIVELRFFGGLTIGEIAENVGMTPKTVEADWYTARAWLHRELGKREESVK